MFRKKYLAKYILILFNFPIFLCILNAELADNSTKTSIKDEIPNTQKYNIEEYIVDIGDVLSIKIFDAPEDSGDYTILNDGTINIGIIGRKYIAGKTIQELTLYIRNFLSKELLRPDLQISIKEVRPIKVSMIGELQKPGIYNLGKTVDTKFPTLIKAIKEAGGITNRSDLENVKLSRKLPDNIGGYKKTTINLLKLLNEGEQIYNPYLFDGDIIKVNKLSNRNIKNSNQKHSNLYPEFINVYVIGKVKNPGLIKIPSDSSLVQSIYYAGGPINTETSARNIELIRTSREGKTIIKRINLDIAQDISSDKNPFLTNGDIIKLNSTLISSGTDSLNAISGPFKAVLPIFQLVDIITD